ncbi:hypothetical protein [Clostridium sp.]|jgi:hypothetical protein|uniref:hypothetical protein n=1 Tax=Clostridium sp. TaxID=1506 RepID=UPI00258FFCDB|nr:hypothetical protein [Clostridium sp.]MDF2504706.1 hypothetical protein [Clostridium sp.]
MNKKKKLIIITAIVLCIVLVCFYRYEKINKNVAKAYEKQEYQIGENVDLDNLKLVVKSYELVQHNKVDNADVLLQLNIKNISEKTIDASTLIDNSKLATEFQYQDYADIKKEDFNHIKNLKPKDELNFQLRYSVLPGVINNSKNKNEFKFYIANKLYKNEITKKYEDLKLYSKYVYLKS